MSRAVGEARRVVLGLRRRSVAVGRRLGALALRGRAVECPACGWRFRHLVPHRDRADARCPRCGALERHRLLWAYVDQTVDLARARRTLHFAPEPQIARKLRAELGGAYVRVDLQPGYDARIDITRLPFRAGSFDLLVCCHVLEHIPDDITAMHELRRVLAVGGTAIIQVPMTGEDSTDEDESLTESERAQRYGQDDHLRLYGRDIVCRLEDAGFVVEEFSGGSLAEERRRRWVVPVDEHLFACT